MSKTNTKTAAKKSAKSTATSNGIRRDTALGDIGKHTAGMRYADYSAETRAMIDEFADKRGLSRDEVVARFEELFAGRGPGKGAKVFSATQSEAVTFADEGNAVTIRVTGKAYANLAKVAAAMNSVAWCDDDNTPATVCDFWIGSLLRRTQYAPGEGGAEDITDLTNDIKDGIDTGHPYESPEDMARKRELSAAIDAVKF